MVLFIDFLLDVVIIYIYSGGYFLWVECWGYVDVMVIYKEVLCLYIIIVLGKLFSLINEFNYCFCLNVLFVLNEVKCN